MIRCRTFQFDGLAGWALSRTLRDHHGARRRRNGYGLPGTRPAPRSQSGAQVPAPRRVRAYIEGQPLTASLAGSPWEFVTTRLPQFDPTGRFIAYLRARAPGTPPTVPEHTVIHTIATGEEREWPEPHTHPTGWSGDARETVGWQHDGSVVICTIADSQCRKVTRGSSPVWPLGSPRLYFSRPVNPAAPQELWSVAIDGSDERFETKIGLFRPIDRSFTVSRDHVAVWANFHAGRHEVWTAAVR